MTPIVESSRALLIVLATSTTRAAVVLATAALLVHSLRGRSANLRHLVWAAALGASVILAPLAPWLPTLHVLPRVQGKTLVAPPAILPSPSHHLWAPNAAAVDVSLHGGSRLAAPTSEPLPLPLSLAVLWALGCALLAARYLGQLKRLHDLALMPVGHSDATLCGAIARDLGIRRHVRLALSSGTQVPLTWGVLAPKVVLPEDASSWTAARRRRVLCHELAHVRRYDVLSQAIATLAEMVFWFFPVVRWASRAARRESELACDDVVLAMGVRPTDYAADLLTVGARALAPAVPALAFASERTASLLERRVVALLDPTRRRAPLTRRSAIVVVGGALLMSVALTTLRSRPADALPVVANRDRTASVAAAPSPLLRSAVSRRVTPVPTITRVSDRTGPADPLATCTAPMNHHDDADDTTWMATGASDECQFTLVATGALGFAANGTDLVSISPGGVFDLVIDEKRTVTHVTVRPGDNGGLVYESDHLSPAAAAPWLSRALVALEHQLAFAATTRLPLILAQHGVDAALNEVAAMQNDHSRFVYLSLLGIRASLDQAQSARAVALAMTIDQDNERARALIVLARTQRLSATSRATISNAAALLSPPDRIRVLATLTRRSE